VAELSKDIARAEWALDVELDRGDGERCCEVEFEGTSDEADMFGRVITREGNCCRIRSNPDGPIPCSFSSKGDLPLGQNFLSLPLRGKKEQGKV